MKKKIFLMLAATAILVCALAVFTGAVEIDADTIVQLDGSFQDVNGNSVTSVRLYDADGHALIWYLNIDGRIVSEKSGDMILVDEEGKTSFKDFSIMYDRNPDHSIVAANLRDNIVASDGTQYDGLIKTFDQESFQFGEYNYDSKRSIQYFYFPISATALVDRMFQQTPIKVADILPGTPINSFGIHSFWQANKLVEIFIPNEVTYFYSERGAGMFTGCSSLERVTFEENSTLVNAGAYTFHNCGSLKELYLPNSVEVVGNRFVQNCSSLEVLSFGASFKSFVNMYGEDMWIMHGSRKLTEIYMPMLDLEQYSNNNWGRIFSDAGNFTLYFTGTEEQLSALAEKFKTAGNNSQIINIVGSDRVVYTNLCDAFYGNKHSTAEQVYEFTSFTEKSYLNSICQRCETVISSKELAPLFTNLGFSAAEYEGGGMSIGFKVDKDAILAYEEATGKTVNYGVFAVLAEKIGANDIFGADGKALEGVIAADITGTDFDIFNLKIVGFTGDQVEKDLAMGAYVGTTKDGATEYAYLQDVTTEKNDKYYFASYNDVKAILDAKNGVSAQ